MVAELLMPGTLKLATKGSLLRCFGTASSPGIRWECSGGVKGSAGGTCVQGPGFSLVWWLWWYIRV